MLDLAYSQLLNTNQELRSELRDEISINKSNEKKIRSLVKELEQCYRTISLQDNTIIVHEKVIEKFKSEISDLQKQLRILQQDKKFKDKVGSIQDDRIIELENKVKRLKVRIRILIDKKIPIDNLDMATTNLIANVNRGPERIENHIRGVGTPMQNPANVIDGIRGSLNTIRVTLQNITTERDQYQNLLHDSIQRVDHLRNQFNDSRNQNLRLQRLLDESRTQAERITQMHTDAFYDENRQVEDLRNQLRDARNQYTNAYWGLRNNWQLAQNRQERIGELLRENFVFRLLIQRKDTQIAEHRRTAYKLTVRYNNDTKHWRRRHAGCIRQAQNWKGQYRNSQNQVQARDQNILNLQGQILALQNNPPNIQCIGMVGYSPPKFHGTAGEDPADYIRDLRQWCEASPNHDPNAGHQHRIRIDGLFESGLKDYAKDWYDIEIKGRNWELQNISDNTGIANIGAINGLANNNALHAIVNGRHRAGHRAGRRRGTT